MDVKTVLQAHGRRVISIPPDASVLEAVGLLHDENIGAVIVKEDEGVMIVGVLSERDIIRELAERGGELLDASVADVMTRDVVACTADSGMDAIIAGMTQYKVRHLPVFDGETLLGLISVRDVMQYRIQQLERGGESRFDRWFPKGKVYLMGKD